MDPITVQIVDPQSSGIISKEAVATLWGVAIGGLIGWGSNWWTNKKADQRLERQQKYDAGALEKRLNANREELKSSAEQENRRMSVRIKLEKIECAYDLLNKIDTNLIEILKEHDAKNKNEEELILYIDKQSSIVQHLSLVSNLYIDEIKEYVSKIERGSKNLYHCVTDSFGEGAPEMFSAKHITRDMHTLVTIAQSELGDIIAKQKLIYILSEASPR